MNVQLHAKHLQTKRDLERQVAEIVVDAGEVIPDQQAIAKLPGDPRALRGIPAIGGRGSLGGAIAGTRPGQGLDRPPK